MIHDGLPWPTKRTPIPEGERVPVEVSVAQRTLIEEHTFVEPDLLRLLDHGTQGASMVVPMLTLDDLEELIGFVAFEANHTDDRRLRERLDDLFAYFQGILDSYEDIYKD